MPTSTLRTVGGSVMMAVPKSILEELGLSANEKVSLRIEGDHLVVEPRRRPKYTLDELLAQCDAGTEPAEVEASEWDRADAFGREEI